MRLVHASIPADDPRSAADILAQLLGGEAMPFPPGGPHAWMAWSGDGAIELEIVPRGDVLHRDDDQGNWRTGDAEAPSRASEVHLAISLARPAAEIIEIAERAGWPARVCDRGGGLFSLVEVWVDGCFMLELLDPEQTARYDQVVTPTNWKRFIAQMQAA
jgi:hypothetical protein